MTKLKLVSLVAIFTVLCCMERAFASGKPTAPSDTKEESHAKKAGKKLGEAGKKLEQAYKETVVKPSKEFRKGVKEGEQKAKTKTK